MEITREWIDTFCPNHCRTSCSDDNIANAYGGWTGLYDRQTGHKEIVHPRCNRCYLLDNIGMDSDQLDFNINIDVTLSFKGD